MLLNSKSRAGDPLSIITAPPANESEAERKERIYRETEAKRVSDAIDHEIQQEKSAMNKGDIVKVLLLGEQH